MPATVKLTSQMRRFYELRFLQGMSQRAIGVLLGIGVPAVSRREARVRDRFVAAGQPEPIAPGRSLVSVSAVSLFN